MRDGGEERPAAGGEDREAAQLEGRPIHLAPRGGLAGLAGGVHDQRLQGGGGGVQGAARRQAEGRLGESSLSSRTSRSSSSDASFGVRSSALPHAAARVLLLGIVGSPAAKAYVGPASPPS